MEETVTINGRTYLTSNTNITQCYATGEWIEKRNAVKLAYILDMHPTHGLTQVLDWVWVGAREYRTNYAVRTFYLESRLGRLEVAHGYQTRGDGQIFNHPTNAKIRLDAHGLARVRAGERMTNDRPDKFRAFNNMVKPFKDYDNSLILETDKKALLERDYHFGVRTLTNKIFEGLNYTYGVELETASGRLSEEDVEGLNLKCEFDGSLRDTPDQRKEDVLGGEYITGVLTGDAGMFQLQNICNMLTKRCTINDKCGVHVHVGGLTFTKENIVYMYILGMQLQNEFFDLLPKSRKKNLYCRPIKELALGIEGLDTPKTPLMYKVMIDEYFNKIFKEVSHGKSEASRQTNKLKNHPMGSKCGYDKNTQRYCWLNFVTAMFDTKGSTSAYTLEFRSHSATLSYTKVKNWVKMCMAFVNFAENHQLSIKRGYWIDKCGEKHNISLPTILRATYPKSNNLLLEYVQERTEKFRYDKGEAEATEYTKETTEVINLTKSQCVL